MWFHTTAIQCVFFATKKPEIIPASIVSDPLGLEYSVFSPKLQPKDLMQFAATLQVLASISLS